ncbi:response regulator [Pleomorphovibrio marinus]|uniref:response regulator n=1 Tax=Pleomorphovibrio marinus TaxID=2164132 RepID=UPI000E0AA0D4|nr:PAS domain S-box protein [Pleomorphovibrio marinus]
MANPHSTYKILVVEDNEGDSILIEEYLHEAIESPVLDFATTFEDAKIALSKKGIEFDVIVLDLTLPDNHGENLIREMCNLCKDSCLIVLTGYTDLEFGAKSLAYGVSDYLLKDEMTPTTLYKSILYSIGRKQASDQLLESEKRYKELFHLSPQPMFLHCLEANKILDVNEAAIQHYGYTKEEFLIMTMDELNPRESDVVLKPTYPHKNGEERPFPLDKIYQHRKKNGEVIQVDLKGNHIEYLGKSAKIVLATDITDRMRYVKAIEDQNNKLQEIAWTQSHIVRAPLSRLMGLVQSLEDLEKELGAKEVKNLIIKSAKELDQVIRKIVSKTDNIEVEKSRKSGPKKNL